MNELIIGENEWLRNDYYADIEVGDVIYPTLEHAYQASKFTDGDLKLEISEAESVREARKIGKNCTPDYFDWISKREQIMETLLRLKFTQSDDELMERLAKTGNVPIVMKSSDDFWGTGDDGSGKNILGKLLEKIRSEIQFITGITGVTESDNDEEDEESEDNSCSLKDTILGVPSSELAEACQEMYDGVVALMTLVDPNDFDAGYISRRTSVSVEAAEDAIEKLRKMQSALNLLTDILAEEEDKDEFYDDDDD